MDTAIKEAVERAQYLTFFLVNEECAISILKVREIIEYDTITTVPKMQGKTPPSLLASRGFSERNSHQRER